MSVRIVQADAREALRELPDSSVHCCVTSPPYFGLRDYGTASWEGGSAECDHRGAPMRTKAQINANCGTGDQGLEDAVKMVSETARALGLNPEHVLVASTGSACTSGSLEPSHVLRAMGVPYTRAHSATRFSLSGYTTEEEIDKVLSVLPGIIEKLRAISPYVKQ